MKFSKNTILLFCSLSLAAACWGHSVYAKSSSLAKILKGVEGSVSLEVMDLEAEKPVFAQGEKTFRNPASTIKVITTAAALETLGPEYQFTTDFYADVPVAGGVLKGDLTIVGGGDPQLVIEKLWRTFKDLFLLHSIQKIEGNIVIDQSLYETTIESYDSYEGFDEDYGRAFRAPLMPLSINFNSFSVMVVPAAKVGDPAQVRVDPPVGYAVIEKARVKTVRGTTVRSDVVIDHIGETGEGVARERLNVKGGVGIENEAVWLYRAARNRPAYAEAILRYLIRQLGVEFNGRVIEKRLSGAEGMPKRLLWSEKSRPLYNVVIDTNKFSLNLAAEHLFLALGRKVRGGRAAVEKSVAVVRDFLKDRGLLYPGTVVENGSGLSRTNRVTVSQLNRVLQMAYKAAGFSWGPELVASLSILGVDGTVKSVFKESALQRQGRFKTGLLSDVRGFSGYVKTKKGRLLVVSMLQNGGRLNRWPGLERAVLERLYDEDF